MDDPSRRPDGSWPRDRPIRWGRVAGNMGWFVIGTAAGAFQLALAIPVLAVGRGWLGVGLAVVGGVLTLFAAWSWVRGRWVIVVAPILTALGVVITAIGTLLTAVMVNRRTSEQIRLAIESSTKADNNNRSIKQVHELTNSRMTELIEAVGKLKLQEGRQLERNDLAAAKDERGRTT